MSDLIHIIGICPDNISHPDMIDLFFIYYYEIQLLINNFKYKLNYIFKWKRLHSRQN